MVPRLLQPVEPPRVETRWHRGSVPPEVQTPLTFRACSHHPSSPKPPPPPSLLFWLLESLRLYLSVSFFLTLVCTMVLWVFFPAFLLPSIGIFSSLRSETVLCSACLPDTPYTCTGIWEGGRRSPEHWCSLSQALGWSLTRGTGSSPTSGVWRAHASCSQIGISENLGHLPRFIHSAN